MRWVALSMASGRSPATFTLGPFGTWLFVTNEDSDSIVTFRADPQTGTLSYHGEATRTGSPVCIIFVGTT